MPEPHQEYAAFISHASANASAAMQLTEALERKGVRCWIAPRDIRPGSEYAGEIIHGIRHSRALVLLLSEAANESPFVRREVERAVHHRKPVFPVRLESIPPSQSLELFISSTHWIDLTSGQMDAIAEKLAGEINALGNDKSNTNTQASSKQTTGHSTSLPPPPPPASFEGTRTIACNNSSELPRDFGKFRLTRLIAESMALVYEAEQSEPRRKVALKIPRGGLLLTQDARQRFMREVSLTAGIDHAGIVPVFEAGEIDGTPFYTMPLIDGVRFDQYLKEQQLDSEGIIRQFISLCDVVGALHVNNLVHRDLKPANILIDSHHHVRLLDFGLAKIGKTVSDLSLAPSVMGSLEYMAPEQAGAKAAAIGPQTDVYAIGIMLYTALTGQKPLGTATQISEMLQRILEKPPRPPREHLPEISAELNALILSCLNKDPEQRPADALALSRALCDSVRDTKQGKRQVRKAILLPAATLAIAGLLYLIWPSAEAPAGNPPASPVQNTASAPAPKSAATLEHRIGSPARATGATDSPELAPGIPTDLWADYSRLKKELREDFARRNQSALLLYAPAEAANPLRVRFTQSGKELSATLKPGQILEIYLAAEQEVRIALNDKTYTRRPSRADVLYLQP